ncbi:DUF6249 domain-containing protein [Flaviaesturariibacter amylovorans]|uniref:DUF6249 domain-containing protein n=1 Tax=Flaviaesturariibacter amylovorans TaxID=1084520 RepID=A0ABP8GVC7_9BACT
MDGAGILVPITLFLSSSAMIFGIYYLRTRENLAILEKGKDPRSPRPYNNLRLGLLLIGGGLGLLLAYLIDMFVTTQNDIEPLYFALIAIGGGGGLLGSYQAEKRAMERTPDLYRREP